MTTLFTNMRISSGEIAAILKKHGVSGVADALQNAYRKRLGQRLMSSIRDESGKREVLAHGSEYVVVQCCNDQQALKAIRRRIQALGGQVLFHTRVTGVASEGQRLRGLLLDGEVMACREITPLLPVL